MVIYGNLCFRHTHALTQYLYTEMKSLRHYNGTKVCDFYGNHEVNYSKKSGPIVTFNLKRANGEFVGYHEVDQLAGLQGIFLRTGCFCNPGACHSYLNLSKEEVISNLEAGHVCWDDKDIIGGKPTGAVRASIGYMSTFEDVEVISGVFRG
jgi:molybdenum cofactor sulfurtransferase